MAGNNDSVTQITKRCIAVIESLQETRSSFEGRRILVVHRMRLQTWVEFLDASNASQTDISEAASLARPLLELVEENLRKGEFPSSLAAERVYLDEHQLIDSGEVLELAKVGESPMPWRVFRAISRPRLVGEANLDAIGESIERLQDIARIFTDSHTASRSAGGLPEAEPGVELMIRGLVKSRFSRLKPSLLQRLGDCTVTRAAIFSQKPEQTQSKRASINYKPRRHNFETKSVISVSPPASVDHEYPDLVEGELNDGTGLCRWCSEVIDARDLDDKSWRR